MALVNGVHTGRDYHLASNHTLALPLPRLSPTPDLDSASSKDGIPRYEVVVAGAGPAGLLLNLLLARYGLPSASRLCVDEQSSATKTGHADGLMPRTIEVLKSLDLADEIINHACHFRESATWVYSEESGGIERQKIETFEMGEHRFAAGIHCIHQGRVERIMEDDLKLYCERGVVRETKCVDVKIDEVGEPEFPVVATLECNGVKSTVRTKYLVGADGGHSAVRRSVGIKMEGEMMDDVWGVVDMVVDSNYPDLRRQSFIESKDGAVLHIPREMKSDRDRITRVYLLFPPAPATESESVVVTNGKTTEDPETQHRDYRADITLESILARAEECFKPFRFKPKQGTDVEWWTAYRVGQRVASPFTLPDSQQHPRVFLIGDACHTHSPKLGQGMNVSMMDAFDLSWKLIHTIFGLTTNGTALLETYASERRDHALNLIDMDKRWYNSRYASLNAGSKRPDQMQLRGETMQFVSGVGIEYEAGSILVDDRVTPDDAESLARYSAGAVREGRRLEDAVVRRFADSNLLHLHDEMESDGRYSVVVWSSKDLIEEGGASQTVLRKLCEELLPKLPAGAVKVFIMHSMEHLSFEWTTLPSCVKAVSEMRLYKAADETYDRFGVDMHLGGMCVVRPDMYVGTITNLSDGPDGLGKVSSYLERCLARVA